MVDLIKYTYGVKCTGLTLILMRLIYEKKKKKIIKSY